MIIGFKNMVYRGILFFCDIFIFLNMYVCSKMRNEDFIFFVYKEFLQMNKKDDCLREKIDKGFGCFVIRKEI